MIRTAVVAMFMMRAWTTGALSYDLVVIGGGSAGLTAAKFAAEFGKSAVIIEKAKLGGDCTWTGCVPSKTLLSSAKVGHTLQTASQYGFSQRKRKVDMKEVVERVDRTIQKIYDADDSADVLKNLGVDTIRGQAVFSSPKTLTVSVSLPEGKSELSVNAKEGVLICSGAAPRRPDESIPGLDSIEYLTYEEIFQLDDLPAKLTVVGGGPIGCELAQAFARLGSRVSLVAQRLFPKNEPEVAPCMERVFQNDNIQLVKGRVQSVQPSKRSTTAHTAICTCDGTTTEIEGDLMLVAVGRVPVVEGLGLETIGVRLNDKNGIGVDDTLMTSVEGVYAAGDCTGDKQFTHYAGYQGAIAARNILLPLTDPGVLTASVPSTIFTSPEVASVGLTEEEAKQIYGTRSISTSTKSLKHIDRAVCEGEENGFIKIIYKSNNFQILGATVVCPAAGEIISEISVAMKGKVSFDTLATVMHAYPSYSFALQAMAAEVYYAKLAKSTGILNFLKKVGL